MQKDIVLINPPSFSVIPIGLEIIAAYFDEFKKSDPKLNNFRVSIIGGAGKNEEEILEIYFNEIGNPAYVGISSWQSNHRSSMTILKKVKEADPGVITLVGGPNTFFTYRQIMKNHPYVDYLVRGSGERSVAELVAGKKESEIPNLVYRNQNQILLSAQQEYVNLNDRPVFNLDHIINKNEYKESSDVVGFPLSSIHGCIYAKRRNGRCSFCSIPSLKTKVIKPEKFWNQVGLLYKKYNIKRFFESGDSFVIGRYPERILKAKPAGLNDVVFRVYAEPGQLNYIMLKTLKAIGVEHVFIGIENLTPFG